MKQKNHKEVRSESQYNQNAKSLNSPIKKKNT